MQSKQVLNWDTSGIGGENIVEIPICDKVSEILETGGT